MGINIINRIIRVIICLNLLQLLLAIAYYVWIYICYPDLLFQFADLPGGGNLLTALNLYGSFVGAILMLISLLVYPLKIIKSGSLGSWDWFGIGLFLALILLYFGKYGYSWILWD